MLKFILLELIAIGSFASAQEYNGTTGLLTEPSADIDSADILNINTYFLH